MQNHILANRASNGSFTIVSDTEPTIAAKFRTIFQSSWCHSRKIYWIDASFGRTRLWEVQKLPRSKKSEDRLIGIFPGGAHLDVLRIAIATTNKGRILTDVRWELYTDFDLTHLIEMGRFDLFDLLGSAENLRELVVNEKIAINTNVRAWDFDGIFLTHVCPKCQKVWGADTLVYIPSCFTCERCGHMGSSKVVGDEELGVVKQLLTLLVANREGVFPAQVAENCPPALAFVDITATPILCWLIHHRMLAGNEADLRRAQDDSLSIEHIRSCSEQSLFARLRVDIVRHAFLAFMDDYYERKLARFERGELPPHRPKFLLDKDDILKEWHMNNVREEQELLHREIDIMARLEDFLFATRETRTTLEHLRAWEKIVRLAELFPLYIDDLINIIWKETGHG